MTNQEVIELLKKIRNDIALYRNRESAFGQLQRSIEIIDSHIAELEQREKI